MYLGKVDLDIPIIDSALICDRLSPLPDELLVRIFSTLSPPDLLASIQVSKSMHVRVVAASNLNEVESIKSFISNLLDRLGTIPKQREMLRTILGKVRSQEFSDLVQLKGYLLGVKDQLLRVLETLDTTEIAALSDIQPPHFMEHIFNLASKIRELLDRVEDTSTNDIFNKVNEYFVRDAATELVEMGAIDNAVKIALSHSRIEGEVLADISMLRAKAGFVDEAIDIVNLSSSESARNYAFERLGRALAQYSKFDKALEVAYLITDEPIKMNCFRGISNTLRSVQEFDRALTVIDLISSKRSKLEALKGILESLIHYRDYDRAEAVVKWIYSIDPRYNLGKLTSFRKNE